MHISKLAINSGAGFDPRASAKALRSFWPDCQLNAETVERLTAGTLRLAVELRANAIDEHELMFRFVGRLKSLLDLSSRFSTPAKAMQPLAYLFADACLALGVIESAKGEIRWDDSDEIGPEFCRAWKKRRFPEGSTLVREAVAYARAQPLQIEGETNSKYVWLLTMASYLQKSQGDKPFSLPIPKIAEATRIPKTTVSNLINLAIDDGYLEVVDSTYVVGKRARMFRYHAPRKRRQKAA